MASQKTSVRAFILSDVVTQFGAGMVLSASAWYIFDESRSNSLVATASAFNTVSGILVSIVAGSVVDRFHPKSVAQFSHILRIGLIVAPLALFTTLGFHPVFAFILALNNGLGWNLYYPASKAIIQQLADRDGRVAINSAAEVSMQVGLFSSGAIAGVVYHLVGFEPILAASAVAFVIGIVILSTVTVPMAADVGHPREETFAQTFRLGFSYLRRTPVALVLALVLYAPFVVAIIFATVLPGYTQTVLGRGSVMYGAIDMFWGVGATVAGMIALKLTKRVKSSIIVTAGLLTLGAYGVAMTFNTSTAFAVGLTAIAGFSAAATRILIYSDLMEVVPPLYLGRVIALTNVVSLLLQTVLAQAAGVLMDLTAPRFGFALVVGVGWLAALAFALTRARRPAIEAAHVTADRV